MPFLLDFVDIIIYRILLHMYNYFTYVVFLFELIL